MRWWKPWRDSLIISTEEVDDDRRSTIDDIAGVFVFFRVVDKNKDKVMSYQSKGTSGTQARDSGTQGHGDQRSRATKRPKTKATEAIKVINRQGSRLKAQGSRKDSRR